MPIDTRPVQGDRKNPLVSVCIPVFNGENFISNALESCVHQTYRNIEIVVVDNASTDKTAEIVLGYAARDPRIKYFRNPVTLPIMRNFYKSFEHASGEFVQHVGHDDWLARNYVEQAVASFGKDPSSAGIMHRTITLLYFKNKFTLQDDISIPDGSYSTGYMSKEILDSEIAGLSFLVFMRRKDVLAAQHAVFELFDHPLYGTLYEGAQGTDWIVFLRVLAEYAHFTFSNRTAFIKVVHSSNAGLSFGHDISNPNGILRFRDFARQCIEPTYREVFPGQLSYMRVVVGSTAIVDIIMAILKKRFEVSYLKKLEYRQFKAFFKDYSFGERIWTVFYAVYLLFARSIRYAFRSDPGPRLPADPEMYFLDDDLNFKSR